ncbi:MAG: hypothetical protein JSW23_08340, partial [Planctomycetota bacterium]
MKAVRRNLALVVVLWFLGGCGAVFGDYIAMWGADGNGLYAVPEGNDFVAVAGGVIHNVAMRSDDTLTAWGWNEFGECDVPTDSNYVAVGAGAFYSAALRSDGSLAAWGRNQVGQCNVPEGNDFVEISCGISHGLALKSDGSLVAWGDNWAGACNVPGSNDFVAIAGGKSYSLALKSNGSLEAWGWNHVGQCNVPEGNDFVAIAAGWIHGIAVRSDGSLAGWGSDYYGQSDVPAGNDFVSVAAGEWHSIALKSDGSLEAWGLNDQGQCNVPAGNDFMVISSGGSHGLALRVSGPGGEPGGDLVSHWRLNESSGKTAYDWVGGNHGFVSEPNWVSGRVGGALGFDGIGGYVDVGDEGSLDFGGATDFSIVLWFETRMTSAGMFVNKRAAGKAAGYDLYINGGKITARISNSSNSFAATTSGTFNDNKWHHLAAVYDRDDVITVYVDGNEAAGSADIGTIGDIDNSQPFTIGDRNDVGDHAYFEGTIDELMVFSKALTGEEVTELYESGIVADIQRFWIEGPNDVIENSTMEYRAMASYSDGSTADLTDS